ncbi:nuclear transport factor 2 family protein [Flavobacteriaceae bacterium]|nr:nuclear transport factor 2 family protein [Flavobacteriaceae bacterium]
MKKLLVFALITLFASCAPQGSHPDFDKNVETVKTLFALQGSEADLDAQLALVHEDIEWQPAFHGSAKIGKEAYRDYLKGWHDVMENVVYTPENYLPGVSVETSMADGSVRTYGTWSGTHSASGKTWELISYHTFDFKEGKIIAGGDYFDAGGLLASLQPEPEAAQ